MNSRIVDEAKALLPQLEPEFRRGVHVLHPGSPFMTPKFRAFTEQVTGSGTIAYTCSVMDVLAGPSLRYERDDGQRAFAMYFVEHPEWLGRSTALVGVAHEAAHFLADTSPARDMRNEKKALASWWRRIGAEAGRSGHDARWLRAAAHLAFRARAIANVSVDTRQLFDGYAMADAVMGGLRAELASVDRPIRQILDSSPPEPFARYCALVEGKRPSSRAPTAKSRRPGKARGPTQVHTMWLGGRLLQTLSDGTSRLDGQPATEQEVRRLIRQRPPTRVVPRAEVLAH